MKVGYARISTSSQRIDRQVFALEEEGVEKIFSDIGTGVSLKRKGFRDLINFIRYGDTVYVDSLDRLGRRDTVILQSLEHIYEREAELFVIDSPGVDFSEYNSEAVLRLIESAQAERDNMLRRQEQGIAIAKQKGVYKGKPNEYGPNAKDKGKRAIYHSVVRALQAGEPIAGIARENGITRKTVYRIKSDLEKSSG